MRGEGVKPDTLIFNYVIQNYARLKHFDDAVRLVHKLISEGLLPSNGTLRPLAYNLIRGMRLVLSQSVC